MASLLAIFAIVLVQIGHPHSAMKKPRPSGFFIVPTLVTLLVSYGIGAKPAEALAVQNTCNSAISVSIFDDSTSIPIQANESISINKPIGSSVTMWGCKPGATDCINSDNPIATVGLLDISSDSNSYSVSAENGYNLGIKIMPIAGIANCPTISCDAKLEDFPNQLKIINPNDVVIACKPPSCVESEELCSSFTSLVTANDSRCKTPGSSYDPSSITSTCPSTIELVVIFSC